MSWNPYKMACPDCSWYGHVWMFVLHHFDKHFGTAR